MKDSEHLGITEWVLVAIEIRQHHNMPIIGARIDHIKFSLKVVCSVIDVK